MWRTCTAWPASPVSPLTRTRPARPWGLTRLGLDPAYGSGPLATIVQDLLSLLIYFGCVTAVVV